MKKTVATLESQDGAKRLLNLNFQGSLDDLTGSDIELQYKGQADQPLMKPHTREIP